MYFIEPPVRTGGVEMRHIIGIALATAIAGPAMAADLSVTVPPPVLVYNWTGIYGGVNGGGAWGQQDPFNILTNRVRS
jgi:outer membrane immunogenic protein